MVAVVLVAEFLSPFKMVANKMMAHPGILLAKTPRIKSQPRYPETLDGHIATVFDVAEKILAIKGFSVLDFLGLEPSLLPILRDALLRAVLLHDIGKANSQFQRMIQGEICCKQAIRHEQISILILLRSQDFREWLFRGTDPQVEFLAVAAALGHHLKIEDLNSVEPQFGSGETTVRLFLSHKQICDLLSFFSQKNKNEPFFFSKDDEINLLDNPLVPLKRWLKVGLGQFGQFSEKQKKLLSVVKSLTISSDVAGSILPHSGFSAGEWLERVLARVCDGDILKKIAVERLAESSPRPFQKLAMENDHRVTFIRAGCGSGKTIAAYLWASKWARKKKLFFCYPTTGTATEGFRDYIIPAELESEADLIHSRAECDLEDILSINGGTHEDRAIAISSLRGWDIPMVICTADFVLGLLQNNRSALFSFPIIAGGAFIFDEVHQYDDRLWASLLGFIRIFSGAAILLMTASLSESRREELQKTLAGHLETIEGPGDLENLPRYQFHWAADALPWEEIIDTLEKKKKILWVANTVDRCIHYGRLARDKNLPVQIYHSRFRYQDRMKCHRRVIEGFSKSGPQLAITTQVCEVSLDLSADLLITELAPIPSLIQRLGRLNRKIRLENPDPPAFAFFLIPPNELPYQPEDLALAKRWIDLLLPKKIISQKQLSETFIEVERGGNTPSPGVVLNWIQCGPFSSIAPLREGEFSLQVIREEDVEFIKIDERQSLHKMITRFSLPMPGAPVVQEFPSWKRIGFVPVVPRGRMEYSQEWGGQWRKKQ